jgi:nucleolar protein 58
LLFQDIEADSEAERKAKKKARKAEKAMAAQANGDVPKKKKKKTVD